ncbi:MAG: hypothetical protein ACYDD1_00170 [Caulobacteraceae bacterium]
MAQPGFHEGDVASFHGAGQSLIKAIHAQSGARIVDIRFARQMACPAFMS